MQETGVQFLGQEDPLEKETAAHSNILAWRIHWTEESVGVIVHEVAESDMTEWLTHFLLINSITLRAASWGSQLRRRLSDFNGKLQTGRSSSYLVDTGLGIQEEKLDGGIVLQVWDALNIEPAREPLPMNHRHTDWWGRKSSCLSYLIWLEDEDFQPNRNKRKSHQFLSAFQVLFIVD